MATTSYEAIRLENIRKNEIFLKSLGLDDLKRSVRLESDSDKGKSGQKRKRYHNDRESDMYFMDGDDKSAIPTRRSSRLLGEKALDIDLDKILPREEKAVKYKISNEEEIALIPDEEYIKRTPISKTQLREYIDEQNSEHGDVISDEAIAHCVYRLNSMSNKALATRMKVIARAAGKQSYEKLLVSYYAFKASGLEDLAESSRNLLLRRGYFKGSTDEVA